MKHSHVAIPQERPHDLQRPLDAPHERRNSADIAGFPWQLVILVTIIILGLLAMILKAAGVL